MNTSSERHPSFLCSKWSLILALVVLEGILLFPEVLIERLSPFDDAAFASNGALFLSIFTDFGAFLSAPMGWLIDYFQHYPGFSIRRYGPGFGVIESAIFAMFGISASTAKFTILLFSTMWILGWFLAIRKWTGDYVTAFFSALLIACFPLSVNYGSVVRLDIPAMMFFAWACYFYASYKASPEKGIRYALLTAVMLAASLYTYQLTMFSIASLFLFMLIFDRTLIFKKPCYQLATVSIFTVILAPFVFFIYKVSPEFYIASAVGLEGADWHVPVSSKLDIDYWAYYAKLIWEISPVPAIGFVLWCAVKLFVPPKKYELFFLLWFMLGYLFYSYMGVKQSRYLFHFVIALLPLTVIAVQDFLHLVSNRMDKNRQRAVAASIFVLFSVWEFSGVNEARSESPYLSRMDEVAKWTVATNQPEKILCYRKFCRMYSFYLRTYDTEKKTSITVVRPFIYPDPLNTSAKEFAKDSASDLASIRGTDNAGNIVDEIKNKKITLLAIEAENFDIGKRGGIYTEVYDKLVLAARNRACCTHVRDFTLLYGPPGNQKETVLNIYRVHDASAL